MIFYEIFYLFILLWSAEVWSHVTSLHAIFYIFLSIYSTRPIFRILLSKWKYLLRIISATSIIRKTSKQQQTGSRLVQHDGWHGSSDLSLGPKVGAARRQRTWQHSRRPLFCPSAGLARQGVASSVGLVVRVSARDEERESMTEEEGRVYIYVYMSLCAIEQHQEGRDAPWGESFEQWM